MKLNNPIFNSRLRTGGYSIDNVNNIVSLPAVPNATYPNVCGMGQSHNADLRISQSDAYTVTRTSDTRLTVTSGTPWTANVLIGQWAFAYINSTGLGSYVRITANTTTTIDTDGYFYAGCDRVKTSVWLPKTIISSNGDGTFSGCCFDGEYIWYAPYGASNFTKINVATGQKIVVSAHGEGANAFWGCCFDGESVWFAPYASSNFVKVNVTTGVKTLFAHGEAANTFRGCCFDGESVWFSPYSATNFVKVNVATGIKTVIAAHGEGVAGAFAGCCFDGESVWYTPNNAANFVKINVTTGVKTVVAANTDGAFYGSCFDGESVWFAPITSSNFIKINATTGVKSIISAHGEGSTPFMGCCFDGESIWFSPYVATNFVKINVATGIKTVVGAVGGGSYINCCFDGESVWYSSNGATVDFIKTTIPRSGRASNYKPIVAGTGVFNNRIGVGTTTPTAKLHIGAGTATASTSPIKFTSGTNLLTPESGAIEYDGYFSYTNNLAARNLLSVYTTTIPTGESYTGKKGQYSADADYLYLCYADNLWVRIAKTAWE